jgi:hypothetical protein
VTVRGGGPVVLFVVFVLCESRRKEKEGACENSVLLILLESKKKSVGLTLAVD